MKVKHGVLQLLYLNEKSRKMYSSRRGILKLRFGIFLIFALCMLTLFLPGQASAQDKSLVVRLAKLQIDTSRLDNYKAALKEEIETSVRIEPGVLTLYAVYEKNNPTHITIFEIYADEEAYKAHLERPISKNTRAPQRKWLSPLNSSRQFPLYWG